MAKQGACQDSIHPRTDPSGEACLTLQVDTAVHWTSLSEHHGIEGDCCCDQLQTILKCSADLHAESESRALMYASWDLRGQW